MVGLDVPLGDGDEAGEPRLGGEQVVVTRIERTLPDAEADREQLADRVEQEPEIHRRDQPLRLVGEGVQPSDESRHRRLARLASCGPVCRVLVGKLGKREVGTNAVERSHQREIASMAVGRRQGGRGPRGQLIDAVPFGGGR